MAIMLLSITAPRRRQPPRRKGPTRRRCPGSASRRTVLSSLPLPRSFLPALCERLIVPHDAQQQDHGAAVERTGFERTGRRLAQPRLQGGGGGVHIGDVRGDGR